MTQEKARKKNKWVRYTMDWYALHITGKFQEGIQTTEMLWVSSKGKEKEFTYIFFQCLLMHLLIHLLHGVKCVPRFL